MGINSCLLNMAEEPSASVNNLTIQNKPYVENSHYILSYRSLIGRG